MFAKIAAVACLSLGLALPCLPDTDVCHLVAYWDGNVLLVNCVGSCKGYPSGPCEGLLVSSGGGDEAVYLCFCGGSRVDAVCDVWWSVEGVYALCRDSCALLGNDCSTADLPPMEPGVSWSVAERVCIGC